MPNLSSPIPRCQPLLGTLAAASLLLGACASLKTLDPERTSRIESRSRVGNYYFLPRGIIDLKGTWAGKKEDVDFATFSITVAQHNEPDRGHRYYLAQCWHPLFDDDVQITVDERGLLTTTNVDSTDQTPAIIDTLAQTVLDVAEIGARLGGSPLSIAGRLAGPPAEYQSSLPFRPFDLSFDPTSGSEVATARRKLAACGFDLAVEPDPTSAKGGGSPLLPSAAPGHARRGVLYRPPATVQIRLTSRSDGHSAFAKNYTVRIPDLGAIATLDLSRAALVKKTTKLAFAGGDLKEVKYTHPSQAKALVAIPASVAAKVKAAVPTLIQIEQSQRPSPTAALEAETNYYNALAARDAARKKAADAAAALPTPAASGGEATAARHNAEAGARLYEAKERAEREKKQAETARIEAEARKLEAETAAKKAP
jgi:hypothetical protein